MLRAMERHEAADAIVIPVILRDCDWHGAPFGKLNATPPGGRPISQYGNRDEALLEVAKAVRSAAARLATKRSSTTYQPTSSYSSRASDNHEPSTSTASTVDMPPFELDLERVGLVVTVPVVLWAFYTTFQGLKDITRQGPDDFVGTIGALVGSAAIVILMSLTSWKLGAEAAASLTGRRSIRGSNEGLIVLIPSFLFFLLLSVFFSFTYYHSNFFGLSSRQMEAERQPRALANIAVPIIDDAIRQAREKQVERVLVSPGAASWTSGIDALVKAVGVIGKRADFLAEELAQKAAAEELARQKAVNSVRDQIAAIKAQLVEQQRVVGAATDLIDLQERGIASLQAEAAKEEDEVRASESGLELDLRGRLRSSLQPAQGKSQASPLGYKPDRGRYQRSSRASASGAEENRGI